MRKKITSFILACAAVPAFCQITLTQSNYPQPTATTPLIDVSSMVTSGPATGSSHVWDYSTVSGTSTSNSYVAVSSDPNFPAAQFMTTNTAKGLTSSLGYNFDVYYEINASGAHAIGIHVPAQIYGIGALTGNNNDTLYILDNIIYYPSTPRPLMKFPATGASAWSSNIRHVVDMQLTVTAASLNKTPMQHVFYWHRSDTMVGWGTLQLPAQSGFNSNVSVLQDQIAQYCVDSFYVGGSPAPPTLTNAFGISQGQISGPRYNRIAFYRAGEFNYQMLFNFADATYTSLLTVFVNTDLPVANGINEVNSTAASTIYPNPVNGDQFAIKMSAEAKAVSVSIRDISGRLIETASPVSAGGMLNVKLNNALADGIYIYTVRDASDKIIANGKLTATK